MMLEPHKLWIEQCDATRDIKEAFGLEKALGYLIGEKLAYFVKEADDDPDFAQELPAFLIEIRMIFDRDEIENYLNNVKRIGALGHVLSDERYEIFKEADPDSKDPSRWAEDVLIIDRIRSLLLE